MTLVEENAESAALFMLVDAKANTQKVCAISNLQSIIKNKGHGMYYKCNRFQKTSFLKHENVEKNSCPQYN